MATMSWITLEDSYVAYAHREVLRIMRENPAHTFYAVALQESYRELEGEINLPFLALNSVEVLREKHDDTSYDMASANWRWTMIRANAPQLEQLQASLNAEANRSTQGHWYRTEKRFLTTMVRVAKRLYVKLKTQKQTTSDFCVYFDDEEGSDDLVRRCLPRSLFLKHFHDSVAKDAAESAGSGSEDRRVAMYLANISEYEDDIFAIGEGAIGQLIPKLLDKKDGCFAAILLGRIGISNPQVLNALRQQAQDLSGPGYYCSKWCASALAMLGDSEYLFKSAEDDALRKIAIGGLIFPYRGFGEPGEWPHRPKLNYRNLERLLNHDSPDWKKIIADELSPGVGFVNIQPDEIDEALRGLTSPHLVIRQHAVCILGERGLGQAAGKRILPALGECLKDTHSNVRRLAIHSISYWKSAAKPFLPAIKLLQQDNDHNVREAAKSVVK